MALNIKDDSVHEAVKRIALITGESQAQAVATAVRERLTRLEKDELAARLLAIGHKTAGRMSPEGGGSIMVPCSTTTGGCRRDRRYVGRHRDPHCRG